MTAGCGDYPVWAAALARRSSTLPERLAPPYVKFTLQEISESH